MLIVVGLVILFGSILGGYTMHHGKIMVLLQWSEFLIIGGAGLGAFVMANPMVVIKRGFARSVALLKPNPYTAKVYAELLQMLTEFYTKARKDGLLGVESHVENPESSDIFKKYPFFYRHHHARAFFADTMKVLLVGAVEDHHLSEILDMDLERMHQEEMAVPAAITKVADSMPGFGIVAAVLGIVITMGSIGGAATEVGEKVAAALVGTFLGILLSYGVFAPIASAVEVRIASEHDYLNSIRVSLLAFARGDGASTCVEFARRSVQPEERPSFAQVDAMRKRQAA
ncbi:MAG: flagellar motor stator protein MotA [Gemmatimonadetes bacterium SCN 70-22]|nr:MAG: flagellar motor stator protein MotA [Gemmatimonadetes bacterium SCN 70-22]